MVEVGAHHGGSSLEGVGGQDGSFIAWKVLDLDLFFLEITFKHFLKILYRATTDQTYTLSVLYTVYRFLQNFN